MKIIEAFLTPNPYSRPQTKLNSVKGLVIHWVANPNASGMANRNFFEDRKLGLTNYGSAHDIIDLNGDLIRCLPYDELSYQVGTTQPYKAGSTQIYTPLVWEKLNTNPNKNIQPYPNNCTIGIECTHLNWDGLMTPDTYETLLDWCVEKIKEFKLTVDDLYLHKEVVGWKDCHMWFVKNPSEWDLFKQKVSRRLNGDEDDMNKVLEYDQWAWDELNVYLGDAFNDGIIEWKWVQSVRDKTLTYKDLILLKVLIDERRRKKA